MLCIAFLPRKVLAHVVTFIVAERSEPVRRKNHRLGLDTVARKQGGQILGPLLAEITRVPVGCSLRPPMGVASVRRAPVLPVPRDGANILGADALHKGLRRGIGTLGRRNIRFRRPQGCIIGCCVAAPGQGEETYGKGKDAGGCTPCPAWRVSDCIKHCPRLHCCPPSPEPAGGEVSPARKVRPPPTRRNCTARVSPSALRDCRARRMR